MATPQGDVIQLTGDPFIDGLVQGSRWEFPSDRTLTYSFHMDPPVPYETWLWTSASMGAMRSALATWSAVANLQFAQVSDPPALYQSSADLALSLYWDPWKPNLVAFGFFPDPAFVDLALTEAGLSRVDYPKPEGDVFINYASGVMDYLQRGELGYWVLIHELGHALGLKQPFDDGGNGRPTFTELGISSYDDGHWTVMSYDDTNPYSLYYGHAMTPMPLDILAIQHIYGSNMSYHTGNDVYRLIDGQVWTIWDAGGVDTIDASALSGPIDLRLEGGTVNYFGYPGAIGIAFNVTIEKAIGSRYSDTLVGNAADNFLVGGAGNDTLVGGGGNDVAVIGNATDHSPGETITGGSGNDVIRFSSTMSGQTLVLTPGVTEIERVVIGTAAGVTTGTTALNVDASAVGNGLSITGNAGANVLIGTVFNDALIGNAGNDIITGGVGNDLLDGGAGADALTGGSGDDTYAVDSVLDVVTEAVAEGADQVNSTVSYILGNNVEGLTLLGVAAINGTGNALANVITGSDGANILDGKEGADTLIGGKGNDTYVVDDSGDLVVETSLVATEVDLVRSSIGFDLSDSSNGNQRAQIENLTLTGTAVVGTGNAKANTIVGSDVANVLDGQGGLDTLKGGKDNDTYHVDLVKMGTGATATVKLEDTIIENLHEGTDDVILRGTVGDLVKTTTLTVGANLEQLDASQTGTTKLNLTGNPLNNRLIGNEADNLLVGLAGDDQLDGGAGNDVLDGGVGVDDLTGGTGDDTYVIDNLGDSVTENPNEGTDMVRVAYNVTGPTLIDLTSVYGGNVEHVQVIGSGLFNLTGNASANHLTGNASSNILNGGAGDDWLDGGLGADTLIGGTGDDTYVIDNPGDVFTENSGEGTDTVQSNRTVDLNQAPFTEIENVVLTGTGAINATGDSGDNVLTGNSAANILVGGDGDDTLTGNAGNDRLSGGLGNDLYVIGQGADVLTENLSEGTDTVQSSITHTLGANFENLTLTGVGAINGTGNDLANVLIGNSAANVLTGGAGDDTLLGMDGNDVFVIGNATDYSPGEILTGGAGNDVIRFAGSTSGQTLVLAPGVTEVEGVTISTAAGVSTGTTALNVDASALSSGLSITGNAGANVLTGTSGNDALTGNAGNDTINSGTGDDWLDGGLGSDTLIGGKGDDTYVIDNLGDSVTENPNEGIDTVKVTYSNSTTTVATVSLSPGLVPLAPTGAQGVAGVLLGAGAAGLPLLTIAVAALYKSFTAVENLTVTGTGLFNLVGSEADNTLIGNSTGNVLWGLGGNDTLVGGAGNDTLIGGEGIDQLNGGLGADLLQGGIGNDVMLLNSVAEFASGEVMDGGDGIDTLRYTGTTAATLILTTRVTSIEQVEIADAAGDASGTAAININAAAVGSGLIIIGNAGDNVFTGTVFADTISGNAGNDVFVIGNATDYSPGEILTGGAGNDVIRFASTTPGQTLVLAPGVTEVEGIAISTAAGVTTGTTALNVDASAVGSGLSVTGNAGANILTGTAFNDVFRGNAGNDTLIGGDGNDWLDGGLGIDNMTGGLGDDTYVIDSPADVFTENPDEGIDTVQINRTVDLNVAPFTEIENVVLTGTAAINATGDSGNNQLTGNSAANVLTGGSGNDTLTGNAGNDTLHGGTGEDAMDGGAGNDAYVVDSLGDTVTESLAGVAGGVDVVQSLVSFKLGDNLEHLRLTGTGNVNGTGNGLNNVLTGNSGDNVLDGGAGADRLTGGEGKDTFLYNTASDSTPSAMDVIVGFIQGEDQIDLRPLGVDDLFFAGLTPTVHGVWYQQSGANTFVLVDVNGNTTPDLKIQLNGLWTLNAADVIGEILPLFTDGADTVDFNHVVAGTYIAGTQYDASGGDDIVTLPSDGAAALAVGFDQAHTFHGGAGNDTITGGGLDDMIDGGAGSDQMVGGGGNDTLSGGAGNDTLDGGAGSDQMAGGSGDDLFMVDHVGDVITENSNEGTDTVQSSVTFVLSVNVENLTLVGGAMSGTGNTLHNIINGNNGDNILSGLVGNDTLIGGSGADQLLGGDGNDELHGGAGQDTVAGGLGDDRVVILVTAGDVDVANGEAGNDTLALSGVVGGTGIVTADLSASDQVTDIGGVADSILVQNNFENFDASMMTGSVNITGSAGNNVLVGSSGDDSLNGGAGADTMIGGTGNDTYVIDVGSDVVVENPLEGIDTIQSSVSYLLSGSVENLTLLGSAAINGIGSSLDNVLHGNSGNNVLIGGEGDDMLNGGAGNDQLDGGSGIDTMSGGPGEDIYILDNPLELGLVTEAAGAGSDLLRIQCLFASPTTIDLTTPSLQNFETVYVFEASGAVNLIGNEAGNTLIGNDEDNVIIGGDGNDTLYGNGGNDLLNGGTGDDVLAGSRGNDTYQVNRGNGEDTILEYASTSGESDTLLYGATINPLDLVLSRQVNDLRIALHGTTDSVTIQNWYVSPTTAQVETIQAGNGQQLLNTRVDQLIQAMAAFSTQNGGITWDQAIDQNPQGVQAVLAANGWQ